MPSAADDSDAPIPGPAPKGPEHPFEPDREQPESAALIYGRFIADLVRKPTHWFRENVILPNKGPKYYWYHRKFKRALPVDECYIDDQACLFEADTEFKRLRMVDKATLDLLRYRRDSCNFWNLSTKNRYYPSDNCQEITDTYDREETNFFIKYGEMTFYANVVTAYNRQKHRMIMERRKAAAVAAEEAASAEEESKKCNNN